MRPRSESGFTLIEVLVALVVTSLILAIVMNASLQAKTRAVAAGEKHSALMLAGSLVAGRSIAPYDPVASSGETGGLRWRVTERQVAGDPRAAVLLAEIAVSVRNGKGVALSTATARRIKAAPRP